jgi:uncharacterized pyridoxal phosphate-containing UPF0001 family protein
VTSAPLLPSDVAANVAAVRARLADAARRAGRDPGEVCLVAVSKTVDVDRIRVNVGEEPQTGGYVPAELRPALERLLGQPRLRLRGLMAIPPLPQDPEDSRPYYRELRKLFEAAREWGVGPEWRELSMGMSGDFEVGIEEGATIVRVGTAVFGARTAAP